MASLPMPQLHCIAIAIIMIMAPIIDHATRLHANDADGDGGCVDDADGDGVLVGASMLVLDDGD